MKPPLPDVTLQALATLDSCSVANAIECFDVRLRNEGFVGNTLRCRFPRLAPTVGYAMTLRVHSSNPPMEGGTYAQRTDWWEELDKLPSPRIVVIEDADRHPGTGAFVGEVHAAIFQALGCVGAVTNGAVRDLPGVERLGFQLFSAALSVSHSYMHVVAVNVPVEVNGLRIQSGDLLHGDEHGLVRIPRRIASQLPEIVRSNHVREQRIIDFCRAPHFSKDGLRRLLSES